MLTAGSPSQPGFIRNPSALVAVGLGVLLIALAVVIRLAPDSGAESSLMEWMRSRNAPRLYGFMESVSGFTGNPGLMLAPVVTLALLALGRVRDAVIFLVVGAIVAVGVYATDFTLGEIAGRGRPLPWETRPSYPSGHTSGSTWFFIFVMFLVARSSLHDLGKGGVVGVLTTLIVFVGFSRVFLHRHWPLDVVGGYALGALGALAAIWLFEALREGNAIDNLIRRVRTGSVIRSGSQQSGQAG